MKKNMGTTDRAIRFIIAVVILSLYALGYLSGIWSIVLLVLSGIFLLTSLVGFCPLYVPFGIHTNGSKAKPTT